MCRIPSSRTTLNIVPRTERFLCSFACILCRASLGCDTKQVEIPVIVVCRWCMWMPFNYVKAALRRWKMGSGCWCCGWNNSDNPDAWERASIQMGLFVTKRMENWFSRWSGIWWTCTRMHWAGESDRPWRRTIDGCVLHWTKLIAFPRFVLPYTRKPGNGMYTIQLIIMLCGLKGMQFCGVRVTTKEGIIYFVVHCEFSWWKLEGK